ncbi:hypothetical protein ABTN34_17680, partial [Acinetobacter baumannii]
MVEYDLLDAKRRLGLEGKTVALCVAGPRADQGAADFVAAIQKVKTVIGVLVSEFVPDPAANLLHFSEGDIPWLLSAADLVVVPGVRQS